MSDAATDTRRYATMIRALAEHAIGLAVDASAHRPKPGEVRVSLTGLLPAARRLLGEAVELPEPPPVESVEVFTDGRGQSRPVYRSLAAYLYCRAGGPVFSFNENVGQDVSRRLWSAWHEFARGGDAAEEVDRIVEANGDCLHPQAFDETPDHWTYRELVGIHALQSLIELTGSRDDLSDRPGWRQRLAEITRYHQFHTQPDYTTYQPWGLAAFLSNPETVMFGEQQLHDTQSHLQIEGGVGALLPALLLADAYASLSA
ncbi:MAG: hypothetical protein AAGH99_14010 [Planctomycetota bacterium]